MKYAKLNLTAELLPPTLSANSDAFLEAGRKLPVNKDEYLELLDSTIQEYTGDLDINVQIASNAEFAALLPTDVETPPAAAIALFTVIDEQPWLFIEWDLIRTLSVEVIKFVVEHEMIHFDQWGRGDLVFCPKGVLWNGKFYSQELIANTFVPDEILTMVTQAAYFPWETEAYARTTDPDVWLKHRKQLQYRTAIDLFLERAVEAGYYSSEWYIENVVNTQDEV